MADSGAFRARRNDWITGITHEYQQAAWPAETSFRHAQAHFTLKGPGHSNALRLPDIIGGSSSAEVTDVPRSAGITPSRTRPIVLNDAPTAKAAAF
jgi:hypothetical protein